MQSLKLFNKTITTIGLKQQEKKTIHADRRVAKLNASPYKQYYSRSGERISLKTENVNKKTYECCIDMLKCHFLTVRYQERHTKHLTFIREGSYYGRFGYKMAADVSATTLSPKRPPKAENQNEKRGAAIKFEEERPNK